MKPSPISDLLKLGLWWVVYCVFTTLAVFGISQINFNR